MENIRVIHVTEHRIEQWISAKIAWNIKIFYQRFKWIILIFKRRQCRQLHLFQQLAEAHCPMNRATQSQRIDKYADHVFTIRMISSGYRSSYDDFLLTVIFMEQGVIGCQQYHIHRRPIVLGQRLQMFLQLAFDRKKVQVSFKALHRRSGKIIGKL
ncbi:hypothetical protein D3C76_272510 [compost metagenome]